MDFEEFKNEIKPQRIAIRWQRFINEKESTDLWTEDNFLLFLENEEAILNYSIYFDGDKVRLFKDGNPKLKEVYKQKLDRLREIYNERFKEPEPEPEPKDHTKYTKHEIYYLLSKLGLTELQEYKHLSETNKAKLLSKILSCNTDTAKKIKNGTDHRYTVNEISKQKIDTFLDKLINEK